MSPRAGQVVRRIGHLLGGVTDALVPQTCVTCGAWISAGSGLACSRCRAEIAEIMRASYCPYCGRTMPPPAIHDDGCARCMHERFWNVAGIARIGAYEPLLRRLITRLKYGGRERNAELAADLLAAAIERQGWPGELRFIVPVPMHWLRRWQRPCDHAALLAAALSQRLNVPMLRAVRRTKHTPSQTHAPSRAVRFKNVRGCFAARPRLGVRLRGRSVCIVDNLLVTGATLHEVSKSLRRAGAGRIYAAVIARSGLAGDAQASATVTDVEAEPADSTGPAGEGTPVDAALTVPERE
jgi:ComF family protein